MTLTQPGGRSGGAQRDDPLRGSYMENIAALNGPTPTGGAIALDRDSLAYSAESQLAASGGQSQQFRYQQQRFNPSASTSSVIALGHFLENRGTLGARAYIPNLSCIRSSGATHKLSTAYPGSTYTARSRYSIESYSVQISGTGAHGVAWHFG